MNRILRSIAVAFLIVTSLSLAAQPAAVKPAPAMRMIFLVRHGAYLSDPANSSPLGPGLTPLGIAQAKLAGARFGAMQGSFNTLLSSPMTRAHETARVIGAELPGLKIEIVPDLTECTPPTRRKEVTKDDSPEAMTLCSAQIDRFFAQRFVPASGAAAREIYVAHGNVIRSLLMRALHVDSEAWLEMSIGHASISEVIVEPDGRIKVISAGDVGHLPPNLQTGAMGMSDKALTVPQ
jgi:serine/threonine-protein phosphatase PGAM5